MLLRDVLRYFHASPVTNKHDIERSGFNPTNEYKCKYELEIEQEYELGAMKRVLAPPKLRDKQL